MQARAVYVRKLYVCTYLLLHALALPDQSVSQQPF